MKIVYCIAATCSLGGMERVLANKANYLASKGYEVFIITTDQRGQKPFFSLDDKIICYDLNINYEINNGRSFVNKLLHYPAKQIRHKKKLEALLHQIRPDIVISMFTNDESFITKIKDGSKKILEIHFSKFKRLQYGRKGLWKLVDIVRTRYDEKLVKKFDKFVVLTEEDKSYWKGAGNIVVIPNSLTFEPEQVGLLEQKKVLAVGRYSHQKGFDILIDLWQKVCSRVGEWHLDIVGDGVLRQVYQKKIHYYGIGDRISLVRPTKDIGQKYMNASIITLPSRYEGLPMVLLEAQSYGLPAVAFKCKCGPGDILTDGTDGFLIGEGDTDEFASKLITLMQDAGLRKKMGAAAKINSRNYTQEKIMGQWMALFEAVLAK